MILEYWDKKIDIRIYSPTYRRGWEEITHTIFDDVTYLVDSEDDKKYNWDYKKIVLPDWVQWNIWRVRNYILDKLEWDVKIMVDDDFIWFWYFEWREKYYLSPKEINEAIKQMVVLSLDMWCKLFWVNLADDPLFYREYSPFSTVAPVLWPFCWHISNNIRYDERIPLKEDYDMSLQHLNKYRKVLRCNKYWYKVKQATNKWWCAVQRNSKEEKRQFDLLVSKWGKDIIKEDLKSSKKRKILDFNPVIKPPLKWI